MVQLILSSQPCPQSLLIFQYPASAIIYSPYYYVKYCFKYDIKKSY